MKRGCYSAIPFILLLVVVVGFIWVMTHRPKSELVVRYDVPYRLFGFISAETKDGGAVVPTYLVTFGYRDEKDLRRGTIQVPKSATKIDGSLSENTIVWDRPVSVEGRDYIVVRMNPRTILPDDDNPLLKQEPFLRDK